MSSGEFARVREIIDRARNLKREKKNEEARIVLEQGLEEFPTNSYLQASLADLYLRQNNPAAAEGLADEILARDPADFRALMVKGDVYYQRRDYSRALDLYQGSFNRREEPFLAGRLIKTYHRLEKLEEALSLCQRLLEKNPNDNYIKKMRALTYEKMGRDDKARQDYSEYLEKSGEDEFAYRENIKLKIRNKPPATRVKELQGLLKFARGSKKFHLHNLLGKELENQKKYSPALEQYRAALEIEPGDPFVLKQAGFCLYRENRPEEALFFLEEAFNSDPDDYFTRSTLLSAYKMAGEIERGIEFFKRIIQNNPSQKKLWGVIRKLSKECEEPDE